MKTSKNETATYLVGGEMTYNCETKIKLSPIDWCEGHYPDRGDVWYGLTPFGSYMVYQTADRDWWILEGLHSCGEDAYGSLEDACDAAQADYASRLGEVLGVKVDKAKDRITGSWDSGDDEDNAEEVTDDCVEQG